MESLHPLFWNDPMGTAHDQGGLPAPDPSLRQAPALGQLCSDLGPDLVQLVDAPAGIEVAIEAVALHDPHERTGNERRGGLLLLAVGSTPADPQLLELVESGAENGLVAIACRADGGWPQALREAATATGVALIAISEHAAWGELYQLISAAIAAEAEPSLQTNTEWLGSGNLTSIAEALAAMTGGMAAIEDMHARVLAFSGGEGSDPMRSGSILNRKVPEEWMRQIRQRGIVDLLFSSEDVIRIDFDNLQPRRAIAVRLGHSVLGSIWLAGSDEQLSPDADEALRRAAPVVAFEMMRQRLAVSVERRIREASLATLLEGGKASAAALERVGLPANEQLVVLVFEVLSRSTSSPAAVAPRMIDLVTMHLHAYERPAVATSLGASSDLALSLNERVYVVTTSRGATDRASLTTLANGCLNQATRALGVELRAGIGHEVGSSNDLALARQSAEDCLAHESEPGQLVTFEEIHDRALIADVDAFVAGWRGGPSQAFAALAEHDRANGTEYLLTLRCILDCFGSNHKVAERLHLHANTVRYRTKRIAEITGVDLGDGEARLALELSLRASPAPEPGVSD